MANTSTWQTDTVSHHQFSCKFNTGNVNNINLTAFDTVWTDSIKVSYWTIRFNKRPMTSATYYVRGYTFDYPPPTIPDSTVEISGVNNFFGRQIGPYAPYRDYNFYATGYNMPKIGVTIKNGKINVSVPLLWAYRLPMPNFNPPPYTDSIKIGGVMVED